jgi:flagellar biosynthesis protein FlhG
MRPWRVVEEGTVENPFTDQADGLRRLMANSPGRRVTFVGGAPAVGVSSVTMNLASALARLGQDVRLLTERADVPTPGAARQSQLVLVDARLDGQGMLSPLAAGADDVVVVLRPQAESITSAYAGIKRLHQAHGLSHVRVLINHVVDAGEAQRIFLNLAGVASRYLSVTLELAGSIRTDVQLAQARRLNMGVVEAFPDSPAAVDIDQLAVCLMRWPAPSPKHARTATPRVATDKVFAGREFSLAPVGA